MSFLFKKVETFLLGKDQRPELRQFHADSVSRFALLKRLKPLVREVLGRVADSSMMNDDVPAVISLLDVVEASFLHGLKLNVDQELSFWHLVCNLDNEEHSEDDIGEAVRACKALRHVKTIGGTSRAWVRQALNYQVFDTSLAPLLADTELVSKYYEPWALLACSEGSSIFVAMVAGLRGVDFNLLVDTGKLDEDVKVPPPRADPSTTALPNTVPANAAATRVRRYRTTEDGTTVAASPVGAKKQSSWLNRAKSAMRGAEKLANTAITRASAALDEAQRRRRLGNTQVTGISLNDIVLSPFKCAHANLDSDLGMPDLIRRCLRFLTSHVGVSDIFMTPVPQAEVIEFERAWTSTRTFAATPGDEHDVHVVAAMVTRFLALLPEPVLTWERFDAICSCASLPNDSSTDARARNLRILVNDLPVNHKPILLELLLLLGRIAGVNTEHTGVIRTEAQLVGGEESKTEGEQEKLDQSSARTALRVAQLARAVGPLMLRRPVRDPPKNVAEAAEQNALQAEESARVASVMSTMIVRVGHIMQDIRAQLDARRDLLTRHIKLVTELHHALGGPRVSMDVPEHATWLKRLWEALVNTHIEDQEHRFLAISPLWMGRGFQSDDPTRDFRGGGVLALKNLVYFCEHHENAVIRMITVVPEGGEPHLRRYPFAITGVNITIMLAEVVGLTGPAQAERFSAIIMANICPPFWRIFHTTSIEAFSQLFCFAFEVFDNILRVVQKELSELLGAFPISVEAMRHKWLHAEAEREAAAAKKAAQAEAKRLAKLKKAEARGRTLSTASSASKGASSTPVVNDDAGSLNDQVGAGVDTGAGAGAGAGAGGHAFDDEESDGTSDGDGDAVDGDGENLRVVALEDVDVAPTIAGLAANTPALPAGNDAPDPALAQASQLDLNGDGFVAEQGDQGAAPADAQAASTEDTGEGTAFAPSDGAVADADNAGAAQAAQSTSDAVEADSSTENGGSPPIPTVDVSADDADAAAVAVTAARDEDEDEDDPVGGDATDTAPDAAVEEDSHDATAPDSAVSDDDDAANGAADGTAPAVVADAGGDESQKCEEVEGSPTAEAGSSTEEQSVRQVGESSPDAALLDEDMRAKVASLLPEGTWNWQRVFVCGEDGGSITDIYDMAADLGVNTTVFAVKDENGTVFGGFADQPWVLTDGYYGDEHAFVYHFDEEGDVKGYHTSDGSNSYFQMATEESIAMGGGGHFAFFLESDLTAGTSGECDTFASPCLTEDEDFDCVGVELWALQKQ